MALPGRRVRAVIRGVARCAGQGRERGGAPRRVEGRPAAVRGEEFVEPGRGGGAGVPSGEVGERPGGETGESEESDGGPAEPAGVKVRQRPAGRGYFGSFGSVRACTEPAVSPVTVCLRPPGQRISHDSMVVASPSPKCKVREDWAR